MLNCLFTYGKFYMKRETTNASYHVLKSLLHDIVGIFWLMYDEKLKLTKDIVTCEDFSLHLKI